MAFRQTSRSARWNVHFVGVACLLLIVASCSTFTVAGSDVSVVGPPSTVTSPASPPANLLDQRLVRQFNVQPGDPPAGWTECCPERVFSEAALHAKSSCIGATILDQQTAGDERQFALDLSPAGLESGHLQAVLRSSTTASATQQIMAALDSPAGDTCAAHVASSDLAIEQGEAADVQATTSTRVDRHLPLPGFTVVTATPYTMGGQAVVKYTDWIDMTYGRFRISLRFDATETASGGEAAWEQSVRASNEEAIIQAEAIRLSGAPI